MLSVEKLRRKPKHFHNFTGLTPQQFDQLLVAIEPLYEKAQAERLSNPNRLRPIGAGRKFKLDLPERLLMSLMYLRLYLTQTLLGYLFDFWTPPTSAASYRGVCWRSYRKYYPSPPERSPWTLP